MWFQVRVTFCDTIYQWQRLNEDEEEVAMNVDDDEPGSDVV